MNSTYQPSLFSSSLPGWLSCTDDAEEFGVRSLPRHRALKRAYVNPNSQNLLWAMVFDIDREDAAVAWEDASMPRPNWITQNPKSGHAHLGYALADPVSRSLKSRATPQRFLARIQHGMTMAMEADRCYTHQLTKTPGHPQHRTFWEHPEPYELRELRDYLGEKLPLRIPRLLAVGEGRNITLFDTLRFWAYKHRHDFSDFNYWLRVCCAMADDFNSFASPLPIRQAHQVAKSVAKWTWKNQYLPLDAAGISAKQKKRQEHGLIVRRSKAMDKTQRILELTR